MGVLWIVLTWHNGSSVLSALHDAINDWNDDQIKWLLDHGAYVNERDTDGSTPLILAVSKHLYQQHVLVLIERGADMRALDGTGRTPMIAALNNEFLNFRNARDTKR